MAARNTGRFAVILPLVLGALLGPGNARANVSYIFEVSGTLAEYNYPEDIVWPWTGTLAVVLDTASDGTFGRDDMVSFDMVSTGISFHEPSLLPFPFEPYFTVAGGKLTSFDAEYVTPFGDGEVTRFIGLAASYHRDVTHRDGEVNGTAVLIPVPEPAPAAMLLLALAAGVGVRCSRAAPAAQGADPGRPRA
jgi:hypothetical protein